MHSISCGALCRVAELGGQMTAEQYSCLSKHPIHRSRFRHYRAANNHGMKCYCKCTDILSRKSEHFSNLSCHNLWQLCNGWGCRMLPRKLNNGKNGLHWPVRPIWPIIPYHAKHSAPAPGRVYQSLRGQMTLLSKNSNCPRVGRI